MFVAQLASWLVAHHHQHWADIITTCSPHKFAQIYAWAKAHGFVFQP